MSKTKQSLAYVFLAASILVGVATLAMALFSVYEILLVAAPGNSVAGQTGWKTGQVVGTAIRTVIGLFVAALLYFKFDRMLNPDRYSLDLQLKKITDTCKTTTTDGVTTPNFYTNASDQGLIDFFERLQTKPDDSKLKQLVFEARLRLSLEDGA